MTAQGEPTLLWHSFPLGLLGADQSGADRTCRGRTSSLPKAFAESLGAGLPAD